MTSSFPPFPLFLPYGIISYREEDAEGIIMGSFIEAKLLNLRQKPLLLNLVCFVAASAVSWGYMANTTLKLKKAAEGLGSLGFMCGLIAVAYYLVREFYVRSKKKQMQWSAGTDGKVRSVLSALRSWHPVLGTLMLYFILWHGFFMLKAGLPLGSSRIIFGSLTLLGLVVMMALGVQLVQQAALRVTHRKVLLVVFVLFLMHLYLKFTL